MISVSMPRSALRTMTSLIKLFIEEVVKFYQAAGVRIDLFLQPGIP